MAAVLTPLGLTHVQFVPLAADAEFFHPITDLAPLLAALRPLAGRSAPPA